MQFTGDNCEIRLYTAAAATGTKDTGGIVGGVLGAVLFLLVGAAVALRVRAHYEKMKPVDFAALASAEFEERWAEMIASGEIQSEEEFAARQAAVKATPRELKRSHIALVEVVGSGQFGAVWKAMLDESPRGGPPAYMVAAKTVLDAKASPEATQELQDEALVMARVTGHLNVVSLVGVVTRGAPLMLIVSYCEYGSLESVLRQRVDEQSPLGINLKLKIGLDAARGMKHLADLHFVHRDLAARNVLLATGMVGKVADFGLSRGVKDPDSESSDYYRARGNTPIPIRWTAPEALDTSKYSTASDVWSFGILMVELYLNAAKGCLYPGLKNADVMQKVVGGLQHSKPPGCNAGVYELLLRCWSFEPKARPTFDVVIEVIEFNWRKEDGAAPTNSQSELSGTTVHAHSMHPLILDQDGYDMPSPTAASAPLTTLDHGSRLSQVILNAQSEPGYQYAQTAPQPANAKEAAPAPTRAERAVGVGNGMQETFFGMLNEPDSDCSFLDL